MELIVYTKDEKRLTTNCNWLGEECGYGDRYLEDGSGSGHGYGSPAGHGFGYGFGNAYGNLGGYGDGSGESDKIFAVEIESNAEKLIGWYFKEVNAEVRAKIAQRVGVGKILERVHAEKIDEKELTAGGKYELYKCKMFGRKRVFLKMTNPSTGTVHMEYVPPRIRSVERALKWRNEGYLPDEIS